MARNRGWKTASLLVIAFTQRLRRMSGEAWYTGQPRFLYRSIILITAIPNELVSLELRSLSEGQARVTVSVVAISTQPGSLRAGSYLERTTTRLSEMSVRENCGRRSSCTKFPRRFGSGRAFFNPSKVSPCGARWVGRARKMCHQQRPLHLVTLTS